MVAVVLLGSAGCTDGREALREYLASDHPSLTAGTADVIDRFETILAKEGNGRKKALALDGEVVAPYRAIVERLTAYEPRHEIVAPHHQAYTELALRQLVVFEATRDAVRDDLSLDAVGVMLQLIRRDLDAWLSGVRADAETRGVTLLRSGAGRTRSGLVP